MAAGAVYQGLENLAFLADHGILNGVGVERRKRLWKACSRAWMLATLCEAAVLGREFVLLAGTSSSRPERKLSVSLQRKRRMDQELQRELIRAESKDPSEWGEAGVVPREQQLFEEKEELRIKREKEEEEEERRKRWLRVLVTGAYLPMSIHSSVDEGILGERWLGVLGLVTGGLALREAWRETI